MKYHLKKNLLVSAAAILSAAIFFSTKYAIAESKADAKKITKKHAKKECLKAGIKGKKELHDCIAEKLNQK